MENNTIFNQILNLNGKLNLGGSEKLFYKILLWPFSRAHVIIVIFDIYIMEESKEKIGIRKSLSRVASSFLLGKKGMNRSYFITKRREVDEVIIYCFNNEKNNENWHLFN